jgi:hypothetical protein
MNAKLSEVLGYIIEDRYLSASRWLVPQILGTCQLKQYLHGLRSVYFMNDGHMMSEFCVQLFEAMAMETHDWKFNAPSLLRDCLLKDLDWIASLLRLRIGTSQHQSAEPNPFNDFILDCEVPWPLNQFFQFNAEYYQALFRLLLHLNYAKWSLRRGTVFVGRRLPVSSGSWQAFFYGYRLRLLHFVQSILHYIMTEVLLRFCDIEV